MDTKITFFIRDRAAHRQAVEPIADVASDRGFDVEISENPFEPTDIGVYTCKFTGYHPSANSELSVSLFHGVDSIYSTGPLRFDWSRFDIGLIPGKCGTEMWKEYSTSFSARPQIGAFCGGWPKFDVLYSDKFESQKEDYKNNLDLRKQRTLLYAPMNKADNRNILELIELVDTSNFDILIKHADFDSIDYTDIYEKAESSDGVRILDSKDNILLPLSISDIVVSDSESVQLEGLVTEAVPIRISDWTHESHRPTEDTEFDFVEVCTQDELTTLTESGPDTVNRKIKALEQSRSDHFANLGCSAPVVMDLIEEIINGSELSIDPVEPAESYSEVDKYKTRIKNGFQRVQSSFVVNLPRSTQEDLLDGESPLRKLSNIVRWN